MDQNNPARFLDTAYNALKANPGATNQILQAAAQGAPVGLRGLAAAAAQQSQQEAQKTMTALQQQGPQPNIVQKLATQGIMSQMDTGLPIAPQMGAPEQMPQQMMAGGGLVSFADGGNVLPPDVIDAIQSHFAEGGDVRGYAGGEDVDISEALRRAFGFGPKAEATAEEMARLERIIAGQRIPIGLEEAAGAYNPSPVSRMTAQMAEGYVPELSMTDKMAKSARAYNPQPYSFSGPHANYPTAPRTMERLAEVGKMSPEAESYLSRMGSTLPDLAPIEEKLAPAIKGLSYLKFLNPVSDVAMALTPTEAGANSDVPYYYPGEGLSPSEAPGSLLTRTEDFAPTGMYKPDVETETLKDDRGNKIPTPSVRKPDATLASQESTVKPDLIEEGKKVDKIFDQATGAKEEGLGAIAPGADMETLRNQIMELRGRKEMSPEIAAKLEDLQSGARTSTILQSLLGGLAGGLSNPYGGRFALGQAAAGALGGYQKGVGSEEEMNRQAFNILRGYADAPAEEQAKAVDLLIGIQEKAAERQSAERIADLKGTDALERLLLSEQGKYGRSALGLGNKQNTQMLGAYNAIQNAKEAELKDTNNPEYYDVLGKRKPDAERKAFTKAVQQIAPMVPEIPIDQLMGLGGNISAAQAGGLGGGAFRIYTRSQ